jgi:hypothetical protein
MIDDLLKTIILNAPNFVGFIFAIWILNQRMLKQDTALEKLTDALLKCAERSEQVKGESFPKENAERSEAPLTDSERAKTET